MTKLQISFTLKEKAGDILHVSYCQQIPQKIKTDNELIPLTSNTYEAKTLYSINMEAEHQHCN